MVRASIISAFIAFLVAPVLGFAAGFNVGKSTLTVAKINGEATLTERGAQIKGISLVNSPLKQGASLYIGPKSEVWLKVVEERDGKSSFLRLSTTSCGTICKYNFSTGVVSTSAFSSGAECEKTQSFHDRAKDIAGLPKQNFSQAQTSSMVSFVSGKIDSRQEGETPLEVGRGPGGGSPQPPQYEVPYEMPPLVTAPTSPGEGREDRVGKLLSGTKEGIGMGQQREGRAGAGEEPPKSELKTDGTISKIPSPKESLNIETRSTTDILNQNLGSQSYVPGSSTVAPLGSGATGSGGNAGGGGNIP